MANEQKGLYFEGDVFLKRYVNGVLGSDLIGPVSGTKLALKAQSEVKPNFSKQRGQRGKVVDSVTVSKPTEFGLGFNRANADLLALLFLGTTAADSVAGGTITAEAVTLPHDTWVQVSQRNISAVTITGSVENTDFVVNSKIGAIKALSTGNIADGASTTFDATYSTVSSLKISGGTESTVEVEVIMDGVNMVDNSDVFVRIPKVPLTPSSDMDLLADEYVTAEFSGEIEKLETEDAEFYVEMDTVYS